MKVWNKKNVLCILLFAALYAAVTAVVCVSGAIAPVLFVCYQITAGILLSGIIYTAFRKIGGFGTAAGLALGLILLLVAIGDAAAWHVIPVIVIAVLAEAVRAAFRYNRAGDVISTVIMSFSTFGYYGQIWFNRDYTYQCALEEMPAGYADALMAASPSWALPAVIIVGAIASILISNAAARLFKLDK